MIINFSPPVFRALFKAFDNSVIYPDAVVLLFWDTASAYVSNRNGGCFTGALTLAQQTLALNQMTAHLLALNDLIASGNTPGIVVAGSVDKVSVTLMPPPATSQWQYWLQTTPYGQQLLALLNVASTGGFYFPGRWPALGSLR